MSGEEYVTRAELRDVVAGPIEKLANKIDILLTSNARMEERYATVQARLERGDDRMNAIECTQGDCQRERARRDQQADEQQEQINSLGERVGVLEVDRHRAAGWLAGWNWLKGAGVIGLAVAAWELLQRVGGGK